MKKKRKGFTLVELLVVIAIIALLMGILMPALAKVRAIAFRVVCGTNLSGLGKAMLIYANDYDDELPQAGYPGSGYTTTLGNGWRLPSRSDAFGGIPGNVTVSSSLYLLVKYTEVGPKQYVCKGTDTTEFKIPTLPGFENLDLDDCWDFGPEPIRWCSYSYHHAINNSPYALSVASSQPGMAVAADRNPWLDAATEDGRRSAFLPDIEPWNGTAEQAKAGNANAHGGEGQNVLFLDSHVAYEKRAFCGVMDDNIYTAWGGGGRPQRQRGSAPNRADDSPSSKVDSLLVNEGEASGGGGPSTNGTTNGTTDTNGDTVRPTV